MFIEKVSSEGDGKISSEENEQMCKFARNIVCVGCEREIVIKMQSKDEENEGNVDVICRRYVKYRMKNTESSHVWKNAQNFFICSELEFVRSLQYI